MEWKTNSLLKEYLNSEKSFLCHIYDDTLHRNRRSSVKLLHFASDTQIRLLVILMHKVVIGEIPFQKKHARKLKRSRNEYLLDKIDTVDSTEQFLKQGRNLIIPFLTKFLHLLPGFLYYLFHKI